MLVVAASRQTLASSISAFESATTSQSNSITRFFCSSPNQQQQDQSQSKLTVEAKVTSQKESDNEGNDEEDADDDGDGVYVNKETGEIGGPRGPEPTRYGDWEKGGRCSDF
uniref:Succinate dehydrogenase assembly factor 4, mitochondrial n=1 Tax=Opuntia streptacantha TaxID=393608 RepID=A0A7C9CDF8_OPUST